MKDNTILLAVLTIAVIIGGYLLGSRGFTVSTPPVMKTIEVSADSKVQIEPDTLVLSAGVRVSHAETQSGAYAEMNESVNAIKAILRQAGIEEKNVQTSGLYAAPDYSWEDGKNILRGYSASESLTVKIEKKGVETANTILDQIAQVQNITINGVSYDVADREPLYAEARKAALEKARTKADEMARAAGVTIVGVASISEDGGSNYPVPMRNYAMMEMLASSADGASESAISPGQVDYTATVHVSYEIR